MTSPARAKMITEPPGKPGYPAVLIGWLVPDVWNRDRIALCERCGQACGEPSDPKTAERALRKHRLGCRPRVRHGRVGDPLALALERSGLRL